MANDLRRRIVAGELAPGADLPSEARLGQDYGVGRATVRRAIAQLRTEQLIDVVHGYGTRVREDVPRERVAVQRGSIIRSRPASPDERATWDLPEGGHVLVVMSGDQIRGTYPADRTDLTTA
ncbi:GntR family transcriptional regulator [Micromonospora zhanjiangensis]